MKHRNKLPSDKRLRWNEIPDGNETPDGSRLPDLYSKAHRAHCMAISTQPDWRNDPTYNLKREKEWEADNGKA